MSQVKLPDAHVTVYLGEEKSIVVPENHPLAGAPTFTSSDDKMLKVRSHPGDPNLCDLKPLFVTKKGEPVAVTIAAAAAEPAKAVKQSKADIKAEGVTTEETTETVDGKTVRTVRTIATPVVVPVEQDETIQHVLVTIRESHAPGHPGVYLADTPGAKAKSEKEAKAEAKAEAKK